LLIFIPVLGRGAESPKLTISGYFLTDYQYYLNPGGKYSYAESPSGSGVYNRKDNVDYNAFEITRTYIHFKLYPVDKMKIQLTLDSRQDPADTLYKLIVRYAYLEYAFRPEFKARVGLQYYPWTQYIHDSIWPYLMMELGYCIYWRIYPTADLGASVLGGVLDEHFQYYVAIFNGEGFTNIENDKYKEYMAMLVGNFGNKDATHGTVAAQYSHHNKESASIVDDGLSGAAMINFWRVRLGGEFLYGTQTFKAGTFPEVDPKRYPGGYFDALKAYEGPAGLLPRNTDVNYGGGAVYFVFKLLDKLDFVGRYDYYDPNFSPSYKNDEATMWMAGLVYKLPAGVQASLDFRQYIYAGEQVSNNRNNDAVPQNIIYTHWKIPF
jgi:hypothetical protein